MNRKSMRFHKRFSVAAVAGALASLALAFAPLASVAAPEPGGVELKMEQFEEIVVVDKNGKQQTKLLPLVRATPGKEIVYFVNYANKGAKPAENVVVTNPVPAGLVYQPGSAQGAGARAEVSVDAGKTFGSLDKLTVPGADGKPRPAVAEDVTTVRWVVTTPVKPGASGKVTYRARLK